MIEQNCVRGEDICIGVKRGTGEVNNFGWRYKLEGYNLVCNSSHGPSMKNNRNFFFPSNETCKAASMSSRSKMGAKMDASVSA
jgi:hypothetical protein